MKITLLKKNYNYRSWKWNYQRKINQNRKWNEFISKWTTIYIQENIFEFYYDILFNSKFIHLVFIFISVYY